MNYITPLTSGVLNSEFEGIQSQINGLLSAPPAPNINAEYIVIPIQLVVNMQNATSTFNYQFGGPYPMNNYTEMTNQLDTVFNQYSRFYYDSLPGSVLFFSV